MEKQLGFGAMRLPTLGSESEVDLAMFGRMVDSFLERGYRHFDTSRVYHGGFSEDAIREVVVKRHPRSAFTLTDKLPAFMVQSHDDLRRYPELQLEHCGIEYFDYYWLHMLGAATARRMEELGAFDFLQELKDAGRIHHIGFSFHDTADVLDAILTAHPEVEYVQLIVNYIDWTNGGIECRRCYETVVAHGRQVFVMEPVKGGLLANLPEEVQRMFKACRPGWSAASWAFRWLASLDNVHCILSGMSTLEQLQDNMNTFDDLTPLNDEERGLLQEVQRILNRRQPNACTYCGACGPVCPQNLAIPTYIGLYNNRLMFSRSGWQSYFYGEVCARSGRPEDCTACGECEKVCPEGVGIAELMKAVPGVM